MLAVLLFIVWALGVPIALGTLLVLVRRGVLRPRRGEGALLFVWGIFWPVTLPVWLGGTLFEAAAGPGRRPRWPGRRSRGRSV